MTLQQQLIKDTPSVVIPSLEYLKYQAHAKVIKIYGAGSADYLMELRKFQTVELSTFSNSLQKAICYSQELFERFLV